MTPQALKSLVFFTLLATSFQVVAVTNSSSDFPIFSLKASALMTLSDKTLVEIAKPIQEDVELELGGEAYDVVLLLNYYNRVDKTLIRKIKMRSPKTGDQLHEIIRLHYKIQPKELRAIQAYTAEHFGSVNSALWQGNIEIGKKYSDSELAKQGLNHPEARFAFNYLPAVLKKYSMHGHRVIFRGTGMKVKYLDQSLKGIKSGNIRKNLYDHKGFASYSASPKVTLGFIRGESGETSFLKEVLAKGMTNSNKNLEVPVVFVRYTNFGMGVLVDSWSSVPGEMEPMRLPEKFQVQNVQLLSTLCKGLKTEVYDYQTSEVSEIDAGKSITELSRDLLLVTTADKNSFIKLKTDQKAIEELCYQRAQFNFPNTYGM